MHGDVMFTEERNGSKIKHLFTNLFNGLSMQSINKLPYIAKAKVYQPVWTWFAGTGEI